MKFRSFAEMLDKLPTDKSCREYLEQIRWNGEPTCPHCNDSFSYKLTTKGEFNGLYKCGFCKKRYTVSIGTVFEGTRIGYRKWFIAIYLFQSHKKGVSSHQLARDLGITQKSAWFMLHRIRKSMNEHNPIKLHGRVELDETFVGGKNKNRHGAKKIPQSQGRSFKDKTPVLGIYQEAIKEIIFRSHKRNPELAVKEVIYHQPAFVRCFVVPDTKGRSLRPIIRNNVQKGSVVISDEWMAYNGLNNAYDHRVVDHRSGQYVTPDGATSNALEGFWTWFKKTYHGTYHTISRKHMQTYANEISFRYNYHRKKEVERFDMLLAMTQFGRVNYKTLIA